MLKNIVIAILVISLAGICIFQGWYLSNVLTELETITADLQLELKAENWDAAQNIYYKLQQRWDKNFVLLSCFLLHEEIDHVSTELLSIGAQLESGNHQLLPGSTARLFYYLEHIQDGDSLRIENIF